MKLGTLVFYRHKNEFNDILTHMKVVEQSLSIEDHLFKDFYGYDRQALFHILYQSDKMWGFVCKSINRKDGTVGYKILNSKNKVNEINDSDIYFALKMDGFNYTHWSEMESEYLIKTTPANTPILKTPSDSSIKRAKRVKLSFGLGQKMLYQIVSLEEGSPRYPNSNSWNSQWDKYAPFTPSQQGYYKSFTNDPYSWNPKMTLHAIPFFRNNITPTTFSVARKANAAMADLRMFINFPNGIPVSFV